MGKGYINEHLGEGKYSLTLKFNRNRAEERISRMQDRIDALGGEIPGLEDAAAQAETDLNQASEDLNMAIETGEQETIETAQGVYLSARQAYVEASRAVTAAKGEKTSLEKRIQTLEKNLPEDKTLDAWCADWTTDLSGEVGTVEVPGERKHVQIRPGYEGRAAFDPERDGQITPIFSTHPAATFFNLALLPGWQRWMPQYRLGEITAINTDTDTCSLTLDSEISSAQSLSVDQDLSLSDVPIEYMSCNSGAFTVGDRVLVEFLNQDFDDPVVVGFESEPLPCAAVLLNKCPEHREYKFSPVDSDLEFYVTPDSGGKLVVFADPDGSTPDGPCEAEHDHWGHFTIDGWGVASVIHAAHADTEFTLQIFPRANQIWDFCSRYPGHPICDGERPRSYARFSGVVYTDWEDTLLAVNTDVNENTDYQSDIDETWEVMDVPGGSGDCEDYTLTKMQHLADAGFPGDAMDLLYCTLDGSPHAVLIVNTDQGAFYLEQAPNEPLSEYEELEDKNYMTRLAEDMTIEPESGDVEITSGGNVLVHHTPAEIRTRVGEVSTERTATGDGNCKVIKFFSNYLLALQVEAVLSPADGQVFTIDDYNLAENWIFISDSDARVFGDQGDEIELINSDANNGTYTIASTEYGPDYQTAKVFLQERLTEPGDGEDIREVKLTNKVFWGRVYNVLYRYVHTGDPDNDYAEIINHEFVQYLHQDWEWNGSEWVPPEDNAITIGPFSGVICDNRESGCGSQQYHPLDPYKLEIGDAGTEPMLFFVGKRNHQAGYAVVSRAHGGTKYSSKRYESEDEAVCPLRVVLDYPEDDQDLVDYFEDLSFYNDLAAEDQ